MGKMQTMVGGKKPVAVAGEGASAFAGLNPATLAAPPSQMVEPVADVLDELGVIESSLQNGAPARRKRSDQKPAKNRRRDWPQWAARIRPATDELLEESRLELVSLTKDTAVTRQLVTEALLEYAGRQELSWLLEVVEAERGRRAGEAS